MNALPNMLAELVKSITEGDANEAFDASRMLGLLIERHAQCRYGDRTYDMLLPAELRQMRLTTALVKELSGELLSVFEDRSDRRSLVVWPLGKTFEPAVVVRLLGYLEKNWAEDDVVTAEILACVYDQSLLSNHWDMIEKIARSGGKGSKELAEQQLKIRRDLADYRGACD